MHDHHSHAHDHDHGGPNHGSHGHDHGHTHAPRDFNRAFAVGVALNTGFVVIEAAYGFVANSLALLADAGHNLGDVLGLLLAWGAAALVKRRPTARHTYGLKRSSILASLANAILLLVAVGMIVMEAVQRLSRPEPVAEITVLWVAIVGIVINTATALMFMRGGKNDINIRGAFLHMAADAAVSLGVVIAALAVMATGWLWLDPVVSIAIAIVITLGTWSLLTGSLNLALDAVPDTIDRPAIETYLASLPDVTEVHDLHIWGMSTTEVALTAHLVRPGAPLDDGLLGRVARELADRFGIVHSTIQIESGDPNHPCQLAPAEVV
ncbi:cobalt-zinc-cadmium efflux system protein [Enhydrobacter aerosaccus]|uniref:Cobalt-zinc-cadmium efflux system protein n=1 Tax=Enhydrobacter aerosaccus TaxID=225324 RepID=A0A1T4T0A8_9HYPH|nr:cation diffusion facilitator family transporter [Enhydrobacter aerosaccus]SKA33905.1 cobalt-zinc-cadmium efflux system protein [Enhydrobacter aerosaccus]